MNSPEMRSTNPGLQNDRMQQGRGGSDSGMNPRMTMVGNESGDKDDESDSNFIPTSRLER